ncbi:MAG: flagellin lysine-N-methylase [Cellulosilyticaceae bacterium]
MLKNTAIYPSYFKDFVCIGGNCTDSCCIGWQIPIDIETYKRYKKVTEPRMKQRLQKELVVKKGSVDSEYVAKIKLKNNRCAFLDKNGWCDIYAEFGEQALSHTCELYPRTMNEVDGNIEYSLTLSCPEACRLILTQKESITYTEMPKIDGTVLISGKFSKLNNCNQWQYYSVFMRKEIIKCLQNKEIPFTLRMQQLKIYAEEINNLCETNQLEKIINVSIKNDIDKRYQKTPREMIELFLVVQQVFKEKKCRQIRYNEFIKILDETFNVKNGVSFKNVKETYEQLDIEYEEKFLKEFSYMLENYFVNYTYERLVPFDQISILESIKRMLLYYDLIKLHLIALLGKGEVGEKEVTDFIQIFTKTYDHGEAYVENIRELYR